MNIHEVPQEKKQFKDGDKAPKKVMYVTNDDGTYTQTSSVGWEPENLVLEQAWQDIDEQLQEVKKQVLNGEKSPIAYHMIRCRMDIPILAKYVGKWQWQVKRHLQPAIYRKLSATILHKYATAFDIPIISLDHID